MTIRAALLIAVLAGFTLCSMGCASPARADTLDEAIELSNAAGLHRDRGEYAQALPLYQRSLSIIEQLFGPEHPAVAVALNNLGVLYRDMGEHGKALPLYQRSLYIREQGAGPDDPSVATALNNLAALYQAMGDYAEALPLYRRALAIREKTYGPEHADVAVSLNNLASLYRAMGEYAQALPLYRRALALAETLLGPAHADTAMGLNNLAAAYESLGEPAKALPLYERSLKIVEQVLGPQHPNTGIALNNLALVYRDMAEYQRALPLYQRALAIWEQSLGPEHPATAIGTNNLAALYRAMGQYARALPLYERNLALRENTLGPRHPDIAVSLNNLAALYENMGDYRKALQLYQRALPIATAAGVPETVWRVQAGMRIVFARMREPELAIVFGTQAVNTIQGLRGQLAGFERQTQRSFLDNKIDAYRGLADLLVGQGRLAEAQQVLAMLKEEEFFDFIRRNDAEDPRRSRIETTGGPEAIASVKALQDTLAALGPGSVVVQYVQAESRVNILLTSASGQTARQAPAAALELNRKIEVFRRALRNPGLRPQVLGQELYEMLIAPIAADLARANARTLMLSLDGTLRYIPFAALYDGERYLVERYGLVIYTEVARENLAARPSPRRSIAGLALTHAIGDFDALPAVKAELEAIVKQGESGVIPGELRFDEEFDMQHIRRALAKGYPLLHIASHFVFSPGTEANSFLLLGDGDRLTLSRIKAEKLDFRQLDLITLSACETGLGGGRNAQGEEIEGFGALAQKLGAKGVIATLWPVADESTGLLMQHFYRGREEGNLTKAEALRQAQLALIRSAAGDSTKRYSHPFFWAPFILMGNWL